MKDRIYSFKKGSYLYIESDEEVEDVFIVESGKIRFTNNNDNIKISHRDAGPGDIFGFVSSLSGRPRMETAVTVTDTSVLVLSTTTFLARLQKNPDLAFKILNYFADYLRQYDDLIFSDHTKEDLLPSETLLFKTGSYYFHKSEYQISLYILNRLLQLYSSFQYADDARRMILDMETAGMRTVLEPFKDGIYNVYSDNQVIFCEDEPGDELYIIKEGKVKIVKYQENAELMLSVLKEGDIFGELAIVSEKPRNATAISFGKTVLLPINLEALKKLIEQSPQILKRIYTAISQRLWFTHIRIDSRLYKQPITRLYAFLENKLLEDNISIKSHSPHSFKFGIDELLEMTGISQAQCNNSIEELLKDPNLQFNFGQITVEKPNNLSARARYFRSRDELSTEEEGKSACLPNDEPEDQPQEEVSSQSLSEKDSILTELDNFTDIY